jgi:hypothetical protein
MASSRRRIQTRGPLEPSGIALKSSQEPGTEPGTRNSEPITYCNGNIFFSSSTDACRPYWFSSNASAY